jgi:hypothetical protein
MPTDLDPKKVQEHAHQGVRRLSNFRNARIMFLRNYVGQYYDQDRGEVGGEALNLIFNAIRSLLPNIVMSYPEHNVRSRYVAYKDYAELLSLALSQHDQETRIADVYRRAITDAIFTLGILKTGIAESDTVYAIDSDDQVDTGQVYTEAVDFDNFVVDPYARDHLFRDAAMMGDRICVPRQTLLESGLYDNALIERLPSAGKNAGGNNKEASSLSMKQLQPSSENLQDEVEIIELWLPDAEAVVTIPGDESVKFKDYLRADDYYGPDEGPYTLLALTPPVPGNPLPVPAVGVWNDLHTLSNRMAKKVIDQAERQKDVVGYRRAAADDAQEALDAGDGDAIAMDDPEGISVHSFGGQKNSNEQHLGQLMGWFNMMAANPQYTSGQSSSADSATEARILSNNANVGLEDMKGLVYDMSAREARKRAWYFHTDPLIDVPLIRREHVPPQYELTDSGPMMMEPGRIEDRQVRLTPEARQGDFLDFHFDIEPESMGRKDQATRFQEFMDFATKIMPATMSAAQTAQALGIPFSAKQFLIKAAKERGIEWMDEVFYDPEFQQQMMAQMMQLPGPEGSQGQMQKSKQPSPMNANAGPQDQTDDLMTQILQNGQPGGVQNSPSPGQQERQQSQAAANPYQSLLKRGQGVS